MGLKWLVYLTPAPSVSPRLFFVTASEKSGPTKMDIDGDDDDDDDDAPISKLIAP